MILEYILIKCAYVIHHFNVHFLLCCCCFFFFANDLLLAVYFIFALEEGNDVRQKANLSNFIEFKMGHEAAETTCNISHAFGPGTNIRDTCSVPGLGRSPGGGHGNPLQYSCLENTMDRGAWWVIVHKVAHSHPMDKTEAT